MSQSIHTARRRARAGFSIMEGLMTAAVLGVLLSSALGISGAVARSGSRGDVETQMVGDARLAVDEMLYQIRSASHVVASQSLTSGGSTLTYTTTAASGSIANSTVSLANTTTSSGSTYVFAAPGYDPAAPTVLLSGVTDYIAIQYDKAAGKVYEVVVPGTGSKRQARTSRRALLKNVKSFYCTFKARDYALATGTSLTVTLRAKPISTPVVYVNGAVRTSNVTVASLGSTATVTLSSLTSGDDVQVVYDVDPSTYATLTSSLTDDEFKPALEATIDIQLAAKDGQNIERVIDLDGAARLRNRRG